MAHNDERMLLESAAAFQAQGDYKSASELYRQALLDNPKSRDALFLYGCLARATGDHGAASDLFRRAIAVAPKDCTLHNALGLTLVDLGNAVEGESSIRRAIQISSRPEFHHSLGRCLEAQGRFPEAISSYKHALKQDSKFADAHVRLGACYRALGRSSEAVQYLEQAITTAPPNTELYCLLGDAHHDLGDMPRAVGAYRGALRLNPKSARAWYSCGCAELARSEYVPAIDCFEKALGQEPKWLAAEHNLARALCELGQTERGMRHFRNCASRTEDPNSALSRAMIALLIPGSPEDDNATILAARRDWAQRDLPTPARASSPVHLEVQRRPIRIGYISSFFNRANWMKPVWALINRHDRSEFEIQLFSCASDSPPESGYQADSRDHFQGISRLSIADSRALIERAGLDILVDLNSYSDASRLRLLALKPAPILVGWFNLYATSGLDSFDYLIGDERVIPAEEERFYTEKILRVSRSYLTFEVTHPAPDVCDPPCCNGSSFAFGALASQVKITDRVVAAWAEILSRSPGSVLLLRNTALASAATRQHLQRRFAQHGVASDRITLEGPSEHFEFLRTYDRIDLALDSFPYNGGTTTTEAIWQGVPVLTFWGDRWVSRTSASILHAGGLDDFVRPDLAGYIDYASDLANSADTPQRLLDLRRGMRSQLISSSACDAKGFTLEMEGLYRRIYEAGKR